jgi:hypothetical protein
MVIEVVFFDHPLAISRLEGGVAYGTIQSDMVTDERVARLVILEAELAPDLAAIVF